MSDRVPLSQSTPPTPQTPPEATKTSEGTTSFMDNTDYQRICDHFDIAYKDRNDSDFANKLSFIVDWAYEKTNSKDRIEALEALHGLKKQLGLGNNPVVAEFGKVGQETIKQLYKYIRLDRERISVEKEMSLLKQNGSQT